MDPSTTSAGPAPKPDPRAAARAAAEARLRPAAPAPQPEIAQASTTAQPGSSTPSGSSSRPAWLAQSSSTSTSSAPGGLFAPKPAADAGWVASDKDDREARKKFARLLDRGIVRDNGYKEAAACVETLHMIAKNIIQSSDPKFRSLKSSNNALKNKVFSVQGGRDYLIALGFRSKTVDFQEHMVFESSVKSMHELEIGAEVLQKHLTELQSRAMSAADRIKYAKQEEAARVARALADIEADRDKVKSRVERDKLQRAREERLAREAADREARAEAERLDLLEEERVRIAEARPPPPPYAGEVSPSGSMSSGSSTGSAFDEAAQAEELDEDPLAPATGGRRRRRNRP